MSMMRRPTPPVLALTGLLTATVLLAVVSRPDGFANRGGQSSNGASPADTGVPVDSRPLPTGAVARLGFARGRDLAGRVEIAAATYSTDGKSIITADWTGAANMKCSPTTENDGPPGSRTPGDGEPPVPTTRMESERTWPRRQLA